MLLRNEFTILILFAEPSIQTKMAMFFSFNLNFNKCDAGHFSPGLLSCPIRLIPSTFTASKTISKPKLIR